MNCDYRMREDQVADEDGVLHTVYGIEAWVGSELIRAVPDVFCEKPKAEYYIGLFNELGLSILHLDDVIDDIL